jgi:hypothetical protein
VTAPHPALIDIAARRPPGPVRDEVEFLRSVDEHRMAAPALAAHECGAMQLTPLTVNTLGIWDLAERRRHLAFWETLREVESRLAPTGTAVAVLKGIATEARWYDEPGQRACSDLDLLLDPAALGEVDAIVDALDPGRNHPSTIAWLVGRRLLQHVDLHVGATQVDLHFDALKLGIPTRQIDEVWASTEVIATPHGPIRVLRPEIELVLLLLHLNKDRFAYLGPFLDVAHIFARAPLDHEFLRRFVAAEGLDVPVWKSLVAVTDVLALDLDDVPRATGPRAWSWERLWGARARLGGHEARARAPSVGRLLAAHASGRTVDTLREARRQILPRRELAEVAGRLEPGRSYVRYLVGRRRFLVPADRASLAEPLGPTSPADLSSGGPLERGGHEEHR